MSPPSAETAKPGLQHLRHDHDGIEADAADQIGNVVDIGERLVGNDCHAVDRIDRLAIIGKQSPAEQFLAAQTVRDA